VSPDLIDAGYLILGNLNWRPSSIDLREDSSWPNQQALESVGVLAGLSEDQVLDLLDVIRDQASQYISAFDADRVSKARKAITRSGGATIRKLVREIKRLRDAAERVRDHLTVMEIKSDPAVHDALDAVIEAYDPAAVRAAGDDFLARTTDLVTTALSVGAQRSQATELLVARFIAYGLKKNEATQRTARLFNAIAMGETTIADTDLSSETPNRSPAIAARLRRLRRNASNRIR
jgi:hypothetical protein